MPLHLPARIVRACMEGALKPVKRWLDREGGDTEAGEEETGWTPLMLAASSGRMQLLDMLIERDAALEARDRIGNTALMLAATGGQVQAVQMLIGHGTAVNAQSYK